MKSTIMFPAVITRRNLLRTSGIVGAGLALSAAIPSRAVHAACTNASVVTGVTNFTNDIGFLIDFVNVEASSNDVNNFQIANNTTQAVSNAWVPWANTEDDFPNHHFRISNSNTNATLASVWQTGGHVRFSIGDDGWTQCSSSNELIGVGASINLTLSGSSSSPKLSAKLA